MNLGYAPKSFLTLAAVFFLAAFTTLQAQTWTAVELGEPETPSSSSVDGNTITMTAAGGIWNSPDVGHFVYQTVVGDFEIVANLTQMDSIYEWSKGGLMARSDAEGDAINAFIFSAPGYGICFQGRQDYGEESQWWGGPTGKPLSWVKLVRKDSIACYLSEDGENWSQVGHKASVELPDTVLIGPCLTSTFGATTITAVFEEATITGNVVVAVKEDNLSSAIPNEFSLSNNYPNPFNPVTTISYALPKTSEVSLIVYDALGREVVTLIEGKRAAGHHKVQFDASQHTSGLYFYQLRADDHAFVKKMVLLK